MAIFFYIHNSLTSLSLGRKPACAIRLLSCKLAVDSTNLSVERGKIMPACHKQRSLSERLYEAQGINTQQLLGHSSEKMTAQYHHIRGLNWVKV